MSLRGRVHESVSADHTLGHVNMLTPILDNHFMVRGLEGFKHHPLNKGQIGLKITGEEIYRRVTQFRPRVDRDVGFRQEYNT